MCRLYFSQSFATTCQVCGETLERSGPWALGANESLTTFSVFAHFERRVVNVLKQNVPLRFG